MNKLNLLLLAGAAALAIDDIHLSWRRTRLPTILLVR